MGIRRLDEASLEFHRGRLTALAEDTPARWGGMDAAAMVCHLRAMVELSLGEIGAPRFLSPVVGKPLGFLFFHVFTRWPKGRKGSTPPVPALCPAPAGPFEEERARLLAAIDRFVARAAAEPRARFPHPVFGRTTLAGWARVHGVHFRHHYRQFGLD